MSVNAPQPTFNPQNFASIMRYIFAMLILRLPSEVQGNDALMQTSAKVAPLRKRIETIYRQQKSQKHVVSVNAIALVIAEEVVDNSLPIEKALKLRPADVLKRARKKKPAIWG